MVKSHLHFFFCELFISLTHFSVGFFFLILGALYILGKYNLFTDTSKINIPSTDFYMKLKIAVSNSLLHIFTWLSIMHLKFNKFKMEILISHHMLNLLSSLPPLSKAAPSF